MACKLLSTDNSVSIYRHSGVGVGRKELAQIFFKQNKTLFSNRQYNYDEVSIGLEFVKKVTN